MNFLHKSIEKVDFMYQREIEVRPAQHIEFFSLLGTCLIVAFGVFGLRPALISFLQQNLFRSQLTELDKKLETKLGELKKGESDLQSVQDYLPILDAAMPENLEEQTYLLDLVKTAADNGFILENFSPSDTSLRQVSISLSFTGNIDNLGNFITALENLKRITYVNNVGAVLDGKIAKVAMEVSIFQTNGEEK